MKRSVSPTRKIERKYWENGYQLVTGIDEVGRGALAGPVVAAAVILPSRCKLGMVRDSKLMAPNARRHAVALIKQQAIAIGVGWASNIEIDQKGLTWSVRQSSLRALEGVTSQLSHLQAASKISANPCTAEEDGTQGVIKKQSPNAVILDGKQNYLPSSYNSHAYIKADQICLCVAAASVVAKVARDNYMEMVAQVYPGYGFDSHKGYATTAHWEALRVAVSPIHRRLFLRKWAALSVN